MYAKLNLKKYLGYLKLKKKKSFSTFFQHYFFSYKGMIVQYVQKRSENDSRLKKKSFNEKKKNGKKTIVKEHKELKNKSR